LADQNGLGDQNAPGDQNALADRNALGDPNAPGDQQAIIVSRAVTIPNRRGLHARAAAKFVTMAERFDASVDVIRDGQSVSARSIMGLMMLGAGCGATIELRAEGWGAKEALDALAALVEAGFEEHD
jgi:phosphocarrier protein